MAKPFILLLKLILNFAAGNYSIGVYNVTYYVRDSSFNTNSCTFTFTVNLAATSAGPPESSSASSTGVLGAGAGGGAAFLLMLVAVAAFIVIRRNARKVLYWPDCLVF